MQNGAIPLCIVYIYKYINLVYKYRNINEIYIVCVYVCKQLIFTIILCVCIYAVYIFYTVYYFMQHTYIHTRVCVRTQDL